QPRHQHVPPAEGVVPHHVGDERHRAAEEAEHDQDGQDDATDEQPAPPRNLGHRSRRPATSAAAASASATVAVVTASRPTLLDRGHVALDAAEGAPLPPRIGFLLAALELLEQLV